MTLAPVRQHGEDCVCTRCVGFEKGNSIAVKHGSYSMLRLQPRAEAIAARLLKLVPLSSPTDGPAIEALAMILSQAEQAGIALATVQTRTVQRATSGDPLTGDERDDLRRLTADLRGWLNSAGRFLDMLGMTPSSRARLGLDIAQTQRAISLIDYYRDRDDEDGELTG